MKRSFSASIKAFEDLTVKKLDHLLHYIAASALRSVKAGNPVDSGWSRASWVASLNVPKDVVFSAATGGFVAGHGWRGNKPPRGSHTYANPKQPGIGRVTRRDKLIISNAVPYIKSVEERYGMAAAMKASIDRAIRAYAARYKDASMSAITSALGNISSMMDEV